MAQAFLPVVGRLSGAPILKEVSLTPERWAQIREIVERALESEDRNAFLAEACLGDDQLRREIESLLAHNPQVLDDPTPRIGNDLKSGLPGESKTVSLWIHREAAAPRRSRSLDELGNGAMIGPYRMLELIGQGGMGEVWLADQREPVRRRVAVKLIKAGMDTREVVARFESERQALALMDHPAIAKVFDAGSTPQGRPYFVMEYVVGIPITD